MALPPTKSQLARLGKRLVADTPAPGDTELYAAVLDAYDRVQGHLVGALRDLDWSQHKLPPLHIVGRTKTLDTLVQKLRRSPEVQLPYVRDIAGVRIVGELTLAQQNSLGTVLEQLPAQGGPVTSCRLIDRRAEPQSGYRALHAALVVDGLLVEVQVRTRLQHLWAEVFERLADQWGRQIRYGHPPDPPAAGERFTLEQRVALIATLQELSLETIEPLEQVTNHAHLVPELSLERLAELRATVERNLLNLVNVLDIAPTGQADGTTVEES